MPFIKFSPWGFRHVRLLYINHPEVGKVLGLLVLFCDQISIYWNSVQYFLHRIYEFIQSKRQIFIKFWREGYKNSLNLGKALVFTSIVSNTQKQDLICFSIMNVLIVSLSLSQRLTDVKNIESKSSWEQVSSLFVYAENIIQFAGNNYMDEL